jgi:hypothetical protein
MAPKWKLFFCISCFSDSALLRYSNFAGFGIALLDRYFSPFGVVFALILFRILGLAELS